MESSRKSTLSEKRNAFALRFHGRKRTHNADEIMAEIVVARNVTPSSRSRRKEATSSPGCCRFARYAKFALRSWPRPLRRRTCC